MLFYKKYKMAITKQNKSGSLNKNKIRYDMFFFISPDKLDTKI